MGWDPSSPHPTLLMATYSSLSTPVVYLIFLTLLPLLYIFEYLLWSICDLYINETTQSIVCGFSFCIWHFLEFSCSLVILITFTVYDTLQYVYTLYCWWPPGLFPGKVSVNGASISNLACVFSLIFSGDIPKRELLDCITFYYSKKSFSLIGTPTGSVSVSTALNSYQCLSKSVCIG